MEKYRIYVIVFAALLLDDKLYGFDYSPIVLDAVLEQKVVTNYLSFFDSTSDVSLTNIAGQTPDTWQSVDHQAITLNKPGSTYWLKFSLQNHTGRDKEWVLSFDYWSYVDFYVKDASADTYTLKKTGTLMPYNARDYPRGNNNFVLITTERGQQVDCIVRLQAVYAKSDFPPETLDFVLYERSWLDKYESNVRQYISVFLGIFLVMFLFNLFVYISVGDKNYLYYLVILLMFMWLTADLSGYNVSILKGVDSFPMVKNFFNIISITLISIFSIQFIRSFLCTEDRYPFWDKVCRSLFIVFLLDALFLLYDFRVGSDVANLVSLLFISVITIILIKSVLDGYPSARFLLIAFVFSIIGSFISIFAQLGILPKHDFYLKYAMPLGNCFEMVLFSFALGYRINLLKKENEAKQLKIIAALKQTELIQNQANANLEQKVQERTQEIILQKNIIQSEKEKSEKLLLNILPKSTSEELIKTGRATPRFYESATVMFTDCVLFTEIAEKLTPSELVADLDYCFGCFDDIIAKYGLEKIKTIGDAYMCVGGVPVKNDTHAIDMIYAGLEIQQFMQKWKKEKKAQGLAPFELRVGINSGPLTAGVVGKKKFAFDVWGKTVNIASRLESSGAPDRVNISGSTYDLVKSKFVCKYRGKIPIKNKGTMDMFFVEHPINQPHDSLAADQNKS